MNSEMENVEVLHQLLGRLISRATECVQSYVHKDIGFDEARGRLLAGIGWVSGNDSMVPDEPRPAVFVEGIDNLILVTSLAEAIEILGDEGGSPVIREAFETDGDRGVWLVPHPDRPQ